MDVVNNLPESLTDEQKKIIVSTLFITRIKNTIELLLTQTTEGDTRQNLILDIHKLVETYSAKFSDEKRNNIRIALDRLDNKSLIVILKSMVSKKTDNTDIQACISRLESEL